MSAYRTKTRELPHKGNALIGKRWLTYNGQTLGTPSFYYPSWWTRQATVSRGNPGPYLVNRGDVGGFFRTQKQEVLVKPKLYEVHSGNYHYRGPIVAYSLSNPRSMYTGHSVDSSESFLNSWGSTAVSRCEPTSPAANALTLAGETVKDGLPKLIGLSTLRDKTLKGLSGDYLNFEFGLKPLLADVRSLYESLRNASRLMEQFARDSGKVVRRSYSLPDEVSAVTTLDSSTALGSPGLVTQQYWGTLGSPRYKTVTVTRRRWFEGAFTYYLPSMTGSYLDTMQNMARTINRTAGMLPTPEVVWELMPWSWAVDWFVNVQALLHNFQTFQLDGTVMRYGYVMEETIHDVRYDLTALRVDGYPAHSLNQSFRTTTKVRYPSSPFGFGLTWDGFSPRQMAITAALGITRAR